MTTKSDGFQSRSQEFSGRLSVAAAINGAFELFSPIGERKWVPGWNPELLHPPDASWAQGQIFRTHEETGEATWVVASLDLEAHQVEYYRVEPGRYVARVRVRCTSGGGDRTEVQTSYGYVGLSEAGNAEIAAMTAEAYSGKMARWEQWIDAYLKRV